MSVKDMLLALCVVVAWGVNFVVIKLGLQGMPPFLLAGLRFTLVAFPAIFFVRRPPIPLRWLVVYGMTISFGQFAFLFLAIKLGMPAGLASLVLQAQAFFTLLLGALLLAERLRWNHIVGIIIATLGMFLLATAGMEGQTSAGITLTTMMLTLSAALSESRDGIEEVIEPYLLQQGLIQRTPRGRMLGRDGWRHLGLEAPKPAALSYSAPSLDGSSKDGGPAKAAKSATITGTKDTPRNAPCPCGSGKKFKQCHGAAGA